jgi:hypothetical protein
MDPFRAGVNLLAVGVDHERRRRRGTGQIATLLSGAYVIAGLAQEEWAWRRFAVEAATAHLDVGPVISHVSAG